MPRGKPSGPDQATLQMALVGYELERERIAGRIREIQSQLGTGKSAAGATAKSAAAPRRKLSAAARRRIAAAQKKRWAEHRRKQAAANKG
ncbi:MAG TPA: hypothetical protein VKR61_22755 [Bryobacteraceae bacterium]|nr:hypothetical protein [Bryobacteraceae bacterium]